MKNNFLKTIFRIIFVSEIVNGLLPTNLVFFLIYFVILLVDFNSFKYLGPLNIFVGIFFLLFWVSIGSILFLMSKGKEVLGTIVSVRMPRDLRRRYIIYIRYEYVYRQRKYKGYNIVRKHSKYLRWAGGKQTTILVNPYLPIFSIIKKFYVDD